MHTHNRVFGCLHSAVFLFLIVAVASVVGQAKDLRVTMVSSIPAPTMKRPVLEDVCSNGLALLDTLGIEKDEPNLLSFWDLERGKTVFQVAKNPWVDHSKTFFDGLIIDGTFRCVAGGRWVIGRQGRFLTLIDAQAVQDMPWVLISADLGDPEPPQLDAGVEHLIGSTMAVNSDKGLVAAGFNVGIRPRIFLYNAKLKGPRILELSQFVQDICWSPDGRRLAVLYSGEIDSKGKFVGNDPHFRPLGIPDIEIIDPASGERQLRFCSGDREAKVAFSPDGTRLYTISLRDKATNQRGAVRIFSASSGNLLKTITSSRYYLHNNLAISPDGRFIVADASTKPPFLPWTLAVLRYGERALYNKTARFVLLDAKTGKVRFEYHEVTPGPPGDTYPMEFAFTPDGRHLLVDPNFAGCGFGERVDVYALDGSR